MVTSDFLANIVYQTATIITDEITFNNIYILQVIIICTIHFNLLTH